MFHFIPLFHTKSKLSGELIWNLIICPFLSIMDIARLEVAISNKLQRKHFYDSFHHSMSESQVTHENSDEKNDENSDESSNVAKPNFPIFFNLSWRKEDFFDISDVRMAKWLHQHQLQLNGIFITDSYRFDSHHNDNLNHNNYNNNSSNHHHHHHHHHEDDVPVDNSSIESDTRIQDMMYCRELKQLDVRSYRKESILFVVNQLIPKYPLLEVICLSYITMSMIEFVASSCPNIKQLSGSSPISSELSLQKVILLLPNLEILQIKTKFHDMDNCKESFSNITSFYYSSDHRDHPKKHVRSKDLLNIISIFPNLTELKFSDVIFSAESNLEFLRTSYTPLLPELKSITLFEGIHGDGFHFLTKSMPNLEKLSICGTYVPMKELKTMFDSCTNLVEISIKGYYEVDNIKNFMNTIFDKCRHLKRLTMESILFTTIANEIYSKLEIITISNCRFLGDASDGWDTVSTCLQRVIFSESQITIEDVYNFANGMKHVVGAQIILDDSDGVSEEDLSELKDIFPTIRFISVVY